MSGRRGGRTELDASDNGGKKRLRAGQVMGLAGRDQELDRSALAIDARVDFRRKSAAEADETVSGLGSPVGRADTHTHTVAYRDRVGG